MKRLLIIGGLLASLAVGVWGGYSLAQQLIIQGLTGQEAVLVQQGGPGGTGFFTNTAAFREGTDYTSIGPGGTSTYNVSNGIGNVIVAGSLTTLNLSLPSVPFNGQVFRLTCPGGTVTTLVISAPFGGALNGLGGAIVPATAITGPNPVVCTTGTVSASAIFQYQLSPSTWFRIN